MNKRPPSLADVAALAGVSPGTVSRALSRPEMLSEPTREKIFSAVRQLRYVPNGAARALAMRRSQTIGAVVPRFGASSFSTLVQALESTLAEQRYTLLLSAPDYQRANDSSAVDTLLQRGVDALAILGYEQHPDIFTDLQEQGIPFVRLWADRNAPWPAVGFDEQEAAGLLVQYLWGLGHRRIAFISGHTQKNERARKRLEGLALALSRHGMTLSPEAMIETDYSFGDGFRAMRTLLERRVQVTAIVCGNDYLATGALAALDAAGVRVPEHVSVASFNDNDFSAYLRPALTTVRLPIESMGREAARYLLARLENTELPALSPLPVELVERASTAAPGKA